MSLEDEITTFLGKQVAEAIDWEVQAEFLIGAGWTRVDVEYGHGNIWVEMIDWAAAHCSRHLEHMGSWVFENPTDATWFKLRWA